jgi:hypothetical protein
MILGLSSCVLKHDPKTPTMTFKVGTGYSLDSSFVDTSATLRIGFSATKGSANMRILVVSKAVDTAAPVDISTIVLVDSQQNSISRDFTFKTGVYRSNSVETYTFKISDEEGYTFTKSIAFTVYPY